MTVALIIAGAAALFTALGGGFALGLHLFRPSMPRKKRIGWSAALAAVLPMIVPMAGFLLEGVDYTLAGTSDLALGALALLTLTAIAGAVLCLPAAWWVTTRLEGPAGTVHDLGGHDEASRDQADMTLLQDQREDRPGSGSAAEPRMKPRAS